MIQLVYVGTSDHVSGKLPYDSVEAGPHKEIECETERLFTVEDLRKALKPFICDFKSPQGIKENIFLSLSGFCFWLIDRKPTPVFSKGCCCPAPGC